MAPTLKRFKYIEEDDVKVEPVPEVYSRWQVKLYVVGADPIEWLFKEEEGRTIEDAQDLIARLKSTARDAWYSGPDVSIKGQHMSAVRLNTWTYEKKAKDV